MVRLPVSDAAGRTDASAALLLLADARLPTGSHAHSFGLEAAVGHGLVGDLDDLVSWVEGCVHTTWFADATATALAARLALLPTGDDDPTPTWQLLDEEVTARIGSTHGRTVSRALGRQLLRTGRGIWTHPAIGHADAVHHDGPTAPLALGAVTAAAGTDPREAALLSLHHAVQSAGTAAIRLLGLDPYAVARLSAVLGPTLTDLATTAAASTPTRPTAAVRFPTTAGPATTTSTVDAPATTAPEALCRFRDLARCLPAAGAPMVDLLLTHHQHAEGRLFAS